MDRLVYSYENGTNKLLSVKDDSSLTNNFSSDIDAGQDDENYHYDKIGQLIKDEQEGLDIEWRVDGKVKSITKSNDQILFFYDGLGNRIAKKSNNNASQGGTKQPIILEMLKVTPWRYIIN